MKRGAGFAIGVVIAVLAAGGGYWFGGQRQQAGQASAGQAPVAAKKERKLLYYRNPMGLPDTSPVPKKDPMGMDYIPVYEGEETADPTDPNQIQISTQKVQKLGVRTEEAQMRTLDKAIRAAGKIQPDERRIYAVSPKFEGYVQRLFVNVTGQPVSKGQPLFEVYSPDLVSAQREYAIATQGAEALKNASQEAQTSMKQLAEASLLRLQNWDISEEQVKALAKSGEAKRTMVFRSPVYGIVTEKKALQGMRFMPGEMLYQVADLSSVWVIADVYEQDIGLIRRGGKAEIRINAYPGRVFSGTISYVYPTLNAETRTIPVRIELANPNQMLKPAMFADVQVPVGAKAAVLTIPNSAVIDSGTRQIALVQPKEGRFEPREVKLGQRGDNYVEVLSGVKAGEMVVVAANFLIDAESNLKAAVGGFGHAAHGASTPQSGGVAGHKGEGTVDSIDSKAGTITLNHGAIASLKWPAMTMEFQVANPSLLANVKPGDAVSFEFVERKPGEWVITSLSSSAARSAGQKHAGH